MKPVKYHFLVNWGDTDAAGIVYYPNFYKWMDQASHHLFSVHGYKVSELFKNEKMGLPLLEAKCQFKSPLFFEDEVYVLSIVNEIRNKVFIIEHEFKKGDIEIAQGYEIRAWTDFSNGKPKAVSIPEVVRLAFFGDESERKRL